MALLPDHFWTEDKFTTFMNDSVSYEMLRTRRWIKTADYNTIWVYCQYKSRNGNNASLYFKATDGVVGTQNSAVKTTALIAYQNTARLTIDVSGFASGLCLLELMTKDNIKCRGIAGILKE